MTSTSTVTGLLSSAGLGSGLDVKGIITSLMAVEAQPLTLLQNKATSINTEISAMGQLMSLTSTMGDKARALSSTSLWTQKTAGSSDATSVTASTTGTAAAGNYAVSVQQLAQGQTVTSRAFASSSASLSQGTITIQLGTYGTSGTSTTFTPQAGSSAVTISIGAADTALSTIRDKINAANAGVQASIITDANGARLSLTSSTTGAVNGFKVTAVESTTTTGLSALNYDPAGNNAQMTLNQSAANAKATVNGIQVESSTNTLSNVSDGLSMTLLKTTSSPVNVTVAADTASMQKAITDFVGAYSALQTAIAQQTKYDIGQAAAKGTSRTDGPLQGDPSVLGFQNQLRGIVNTTSTTSAVFARLSDIGISVQADGTLAVSNSTKLTAALQQPGELSKLFTTQGTTDAGTGIAVRFAALASAATGMDGTLYSRNAGLRGELTLNQKNQDAMQVHLDATQARLTAQYQALDTTMSKMSALSSYVSQQIAMMQK